jgi:hypothetical protein
MQSAPTMLSSFFFFLDFLNRFSLRSPILDFKDIRPLGVALIHADRQTDRNDERAQKGGLFEVLDIHGGSVGGPVLLEYDTSRVSVSSRFYAKQLLRLQQFKGQKDPNRQWIPC